METKIENMLPEIADDILQGIGSWLKEPDINAFVGVNKRLHMLFQPDRLATQLLLKVATGEQDNAEMSVIHPDLQLRRGTVTDYSGRTFKNITAYEYAYWAKDKHMCRMLEQYMNAKTKAAMLKCCEAIEENGLTYAQHGIKVTGSKHFDFAPLIKALQDYIDGYNNDAGADMNAAWIEVCKAQHDVPAHVINEYCREDRSFEPTPAFQEEHLPRTSTFHNVTTGEEKSWFLLHISGSADRDGTIALTRAAATTALPNNALGWDREPVLRVMVDLKAIKQLDIVRTADLVQSRENLACAIPRLDTGFHCS